MIYGPYTLSEEELLDWVKISMTSPRYRGTTEKNARLAYLNMIVRVWKRWSYMIELPMLLHHQKIFGNSFRNIGSPLLGVVSYSGCSLSHEQ